MESNPGMDPKLLRPLCDSFRTRLKSALLGAGICRLLIAGLLLLPGFMLLDWWLSLAAGWRVLTLAAYLAVLGLVFLRTIKNPLSDKWTDAQVLAYLDSVQPEGQGMLLELHELMLGKEIEEIESEPGRELADSAVQELTPLVKEAEKSESIYRQGLFRWVKGAVITAAVFVAFAVPMKSYLAIGAERFFNPFSSTRWPTLTEIEVAEPATGWTVPQLESFGINAEVRGVIPHEVTLAYRSESAGSWTKEKIRIGEENRVSYTFPEVREPFRFYLEGGDYTTDVLDVRIIERPFLKKISAHYDYPDYAGVPDRIVESGQLIGLEGTKVRMVWECSMALTRAKIVMEGAEPEELKLTSETVFEKTILLEKDTSYAIELYEQNGYREAKPERYDIRVTPDNLPEVEFLAPGQDVAATGKASLDVTFRASDDFGLASVKFLYQIEDGDAQELTDRITGPIRQTGKSSEARFTWKLGQTELPNQGTVRYFVRVQDINPTGRGKAQTETFQIQLIKPSEFHLEAIRKAKRLDNEARIAWENQLRAWKLGLKWIEEGTGKEDDLLWRDMEDSQSAAVRAGRAMKLHLKTLTDAYEQNDMAREFMAVRLGRIADLLKHLTEALHTEIAVQVRQARPRTAADAQEGRLKEIRTKAHSKFKDNQKLAVLNCERILRKMYDWRDLQTTLVKATLLNEEQEEILGLTEKIAPRFIGAEIEDLSDEDQDALLTLAKRQRTLYDVETELESQLVMMRFKAGKQKRTSIEKPLKAAYKGLRSNRVNDNLKLAARMIGNNQPFQIIKNQKSAMHALNIVKGGLFLAGQKVDEDEPVTLAMVPGELADFEEAKIAKAEPEKTEPQSTEPAAEVQALSPEELLAELPLGDDPLSAAIQLAWEIEDSVLARTKYLSENSSPDEMPRYVRLKLGILKERQDGALLAIDRGMKESEEAPQPIKDGLARVRQEFLQSNRLLNVPRLGKGTQQIQADAMATLKDMQQYISLDKTVADSAGENKLREGKDTFGREFLLQESDLDAAVEIIQILNEARLGQKDIHRKLLRFLSFPPAAGAKIPAEIEQANRSRATQLQRVLGKRIAGISGPLESITEEARADVVKTGLEEVAALELNAIAGELESGAKDKEAEAGAQEAVSLIDQSLQSMRDLLEERVRPKPAIAATAEKDVKPMTAEELERLYSPESLRAKLGADESLPKEVREIMMRALSKDFPPRYRELLKAYYGSFVNIEGEE